MVTKYKVGDIVKVRKDLMPGHFYGSYRFMKSMKKLAGKTCMILNVLHESGVYLVTDSDFKWTDEMFEGLAEDTKISSAKYKVGDEVKVREDLVVNAVYDGCLFASPMQTLKGKTCTIEAFFDDNAYKLKGSGYLWTEAMFEDIAENTKVNTFTKADLKDGMIVEYRNGEKLLVLGDNLINQYERSHNSLFHYKNDLTISLSHFDNFDIVKVYKSVNSTSFSDLFDDNCLELIWEKNIGYNGKVVCIDRQTCRWTVGKIYEFVDGVVVNDLGERCSVVESFDHLNKVSEANWLEIVE